MLYPELNRLDGLIKGQLLLQRLLNLHVGVDDIGTFDFISISLIKVAW